MKIKFGFTVEIKRGKKPVLEEDFHPSGDVYSSTERAEEEQEHELKVGFQRSEDW